MLSAIAVSARGQSRARAIVRPHEQRIEHARGRPRVGQAFVAPWRHGRQCECRPSEQSRDTVGLAYVVQRVAPHALGIRTPSVEDPRPFDILALLTREAKVPRDRFEPVSWQIACGEIVAAHGIQRIYQFASWHRIAHWTLSFFALRGIALARFAAPWTIPARGGAAQEA